MFLERMGSLESGGVVEKLKDSSGAGVERASMIWEGEERKPLVGPGEEDHGLQCIRGPVKHCKKNEWIQSKL